MNSSMDMAASMDMVGRARMQVQFQPWSLTETLLTFLMWSIMMVGMMMPSASPMVLLYARVSRHRDNQPSHRNDLTKELSLCIAGYLLVWTLFSALATALQYGLESLALLSPILVSTSHILAGALLILAGLYQLTPWKENCLRLCQMPAAFIASHYRPGAKGALKMGLQHGAYCVGCCWALMLLLFVGGVMNLWWVLLLTLYVLVEKLVRFGNVIKLSAAALLTAYGSYLLLG